MKPQQTQTRARLKEMILYVARRYRGEAAVELTRLNAILFCVDYWTYSDAGASVTGQEYVLHGGEPEPQNLRSVLSEMYSAGEIDLDTAGRKLTALSDADLGAFTDAQISFVNGVIARFRAPPA